MRLLFTMACLLVTGLFSPGASAECFLKAGNRYAIDPDYLRAIAWQESRYHPAFIHYNRGRHGEILSADYGLMQINTLTLRGLKNQYPALSENKLLSDPCLNIFVGAMVLRKNFDQYGMTWLAVGVYNAGVKNRKTSIAQRYHYARLIDHHYKMIKTGQIPRAAIGD